MTGGQCGAGDAAVGRRRCTRWSGASSATATSRAGQRQDDRLHRVRAPSTPRVSCAATGSSSVSSPMSSECRGTRSTRRPSGSSTQGYRRARGADAGRDRGEAETCAHGHPIVAGGAAGRAFRGPMSRRVRRCGSCGFENEAEDLLHDPKALGLVARLEGTLGACDDERVPGRCGRRAGVPRGHAQAWPRRCRSSPTPRRPLARPCPRRLALGQRYGR